MSLPNTTRQLLAWCICLRIGLCVFNKRRNKKRILALLIIDYNLRFTEQQQQIITKWIIAAEKAMNANKPPSKSALELQQEKEKKQKAKEMKQNRAGSCHSKSMEKKKQKNRNG